MHKLSLFVVLFVFLIGCVTQQSPTNKFVCPDGSTVDSSDACKPDLNGSLKLNSAHWDCPVTFDLNTCNQSFDLATCWRLDYSLKLPSNYVKYYEDRNWNVVSDNRKPSLACVPFIGGKNVNYSQAPLKAHPIIVEEQVSTLGEGVDLGYFVAEGTNGVLSDIPKNLPFRQENRIDLCCWDPITLQKLSKENISLTMDNAEVCDSIILKPLCSE